MSATLDSSFWASYFTFTADPFCSQVLIDSSFWASY